MSSTGTVNGDLYYCVSPRVLNQFCGELKGSVTGTSGLVIGNLKVPGHTGGAQFYVNQPATDLIGQCGLNPAVDHTGIAFKLPPGCPTALEGVTVYGEGEL